MLFSMKDETAGDQAGCATGYTGLRGAKAGAGRPLRRGPTRLVLKVSKTAEGEIRQPMNARTAVTKWGQKRHRYLLRTGTQIVKV